MAINYGQIGGNLGSGIGQGLKQLAEHKLHQKLRQQEEERSAEVFIRAGLDREDALAIAKQPAEFQNMIFQKLEGLQFGGKNQSQSQVQPKVASAPMQAMSGLGEPQSQQPSSEKMSSEQNLAQKDENPVQEQQPRPDVDSDFLMKPGSKIFKISAGKGENPNVERRHQEKLDLERELTGFKETKEERLNAVHKAQSAKEDLRSLERFEDLEKEGNLDTPGYLEFLKRSGLDISNLKDPSSQEFEKLQSSFLKNAKEYFGGRISNYEVEQFLKTIPTLSQSPEGRKRVITNLKYIARGSLLHYEAMKEIIKENKGVPPLDLVEKTFDRTEKKMDALSDKFRDELKKPVPKAQNPLVTAAQSTLGSIAGHPAVQGAALGAGIGRLGGVGGAATGAAIGGALGLGASALNGLKSLGFLK